MSCAVCTRDVCAVLCCQVNCLLSSAFVLASCQTCTLDENYYLITMDMVTNLSTHCAILEPWLCHVYIPWDILVSVYESQLLQLGCGAWLISVLIRMIHTTTMMMMMMIWTGQQLRLDYDGFIANCIWRREIWCDIILCVWVNPHYTLAAAAAAADDDDDDDLTLEIMDMVLPSCWYYYLLMLVIMSDSGSQ